MERKRRATVRPYPRNSPRAAARIVALALLSNRRLVPDELDVLESNGAIELLGLTRMEWHDVLCELCEDLLATSDGVSPCAFDAETIARLLDDIDDERLRRRVLCLCRAAARADSDEQLGEWILLQAAIERSGDAHRQH